MLQLLALIAVLAAASTACGGDSKGADVGVLFAGSGDADDVKVAYWDLEERIQAAGCTSRLVVSDTSSYRDMKNAAVSRDSVDPARDFHFVLEVSDFNVEEVGGPSYSSVTGQAVESSGYAADASLALKLASDRTIWQQEISIYPDFPETITVPESQYSYGVAWEPSFAREVSQGGLAKMLKSVCGPDRAATSGDLESYAGAREKTIAALDGICRPLIPTNREWHSVDDLGPDSFFVRGNSRAQSAMAKTVGKLSRLDPPVEFRTQVATLTATLDALQKKIAAMLAAARRAYLGNLRGPVDFARVDKELERISDLQNFQFGTLTISAERLAGAIGVTACLPSQWANH